MRYSRATIPHTDFIIHVNQFYGLEKLIAGLFFYIISLIPYRKAEKWAWYMILVIGGIHMLGILILWTLHAPFRKGIQVNNSIILSGKPMVSEEFLVGGCGYRYCVR